VTVSVRRLILFDIDGTLVAGGPAKDAFLEAMLDTFGTTGDAEGITFAGKTDPQIARELLSAAGLEHGDIDAGFAALWPRYLGYLEEKLVTRPMRVLPGVRPLLEDLSSRSDVGVGLLTGNIEGGARLKLASAELWEHFRVGSYGSDHEMRDELPGIALGRACEIWGTDLEAKSAVVVGDTPRDVACGRSGGARTLGVATGRYGSDELWAAGADHVLDDLAETSEVVAWLVS
jgi:phosphoglycolate phosphatase-like HAD superfamily hydrolase